MSKCKCIFGTHTFTKSGEIYNYFIHNKYNTYFVNIRDGSYLSYSISEFNKKFIDLIVLRENKLKRILK